MHIIYKLDPRTKVLLILILTLLVFLIDSLPVAAGFMLCIFFLRLNAGIPFPELKTFKNLSVLVLFLIFIQTLLAPGENFIVKPLFPPDFPVLGGRGSLKWEGFILGLMITCRLVTLVLLLPMLTKTTSPYRIAAGLAAFGINYRICFIITTALNLIPLFHEEGRSIINAQKLRGMNSFDEGSFFARLKNMPGLVVPLVLSAMHKAQLSSVAMDSRAFGIYKTRTWLDKPVMKTPDYLSLICGAVFFVLVLLLNYLL